MTTLLLTVGAVFGISLATAFYAPRRMIALVPVFIIAALFVPVIASEHRRDHADANPAVFELTALAGILISASGVAAGRRLRRRRRY